MGSTPPYFGGKLQLLTQICNIIKANPFMDEDPSDFDIKRKQWSQSIRRKEVGNYMQKRRYSILATDLLANSNAVDDNDKINFLLKLIDQFQFKTPLSFFQEIMELDTTLSLFYNITGFNPDSPPNFIRRLLEENVHLRTHYEHFACQQWRQRSWMSQQLEGIRILYKQIQEWWLKQNQTIKNIINLINRVDNINFIVRSDIIEFVNIVNNVIVIFDIIVKVLGENSLVVMLVGENVCLMEKERDMCIRLVYNLLAAKDQLLLPHIDNLLDADGLNCNSLNLYYNFFLIQGTSPIMRVKMIKYFVTVLQSDNERLLQDHKQLIFTLHIFTKTNQKFNGPERSDYIDVGQRIVKILNNLLKVLNLRYQNSGLYLESQLSCSPNDDSEFVKYIAFIMDYLTDETEVLRLLMEHPHIATFIFNHMQLSSKSAEWQTTLSLLRILVKSSFDHCSIYYFITNHLLTQHKLITMVTKLSDKSNYKMGRQLNIDVMSLLVLVCSNFCSEPKIAQLFLNSNFLQLSTNMYYLYQNNNFRGFRIECQFLFINLLLHLKKTLVEREQAQTILAVIFSNQSMLSMLIDLLRYTLDSKEISNVIRALTFLAFLFKIESCDEEYTGMLAKLQQQSTLKARLFELQDCGNEQIEERVYVIRAILRETNLAQQQNDVIA